MLKTIRKKIGQIIADCGFKIADYITNISTKSGKTSIQKNPKSEIRNPKSS
jgi:hypothetical protein